MTVTEVIRELAFNAKQDEEGRAHASKYVVVAEHDYMSAHICCLYGVPGGYGVVTKIASVRNGINNFLAGFIPAENMRFRAEAITFNVSAADGGTDAVLAESGGSKGVLGVVSYP